MTPISRNLIFTIAILGILPLTGAQAQWYSSYPQAPYGVPAQQPYAVEVAPNTYVIHRPEKPHASAHVRCVKGCSAPANDRAATHADPALIEELAKRSAKIKVVNTHTTKVVREKPTIVEHKHVVDDPPRVIERRHIAEDAPGRGLIHPLHEVGEEDVVIEPGGSPSESKRLVKGKHAARGASTKRVIRADAEVTILGPDRMSIRLFRKGRGSGGDSNAEIVQ